tara:strand:- start:3895 stop:6735 length:2841 start_codon:yes stop_codon:yes gene_type:complete
MAINQPMFATGNIYTAKSNFFADYLYTRIKLTDQKNKEMMQVELEALSRNQAQLKDEAVRIQTNITNLQRSLLSREQAIISKSEGTGSLSARRAGDSTRERRAIQTRFDADLKKATELHEKNKRHRAQVEGRLGPARTNFLANVNQKIIADPNFPDTNNPRHLEILKQAYRKHGGTNDELMPPPDGPEGSYFIEFYKALKDAFPNRDAHLAFKQAISEEFRDNDWTVPVLMSEAGPGEASLQAAIGDYDDREFQRRIAEPLTEKMRRDKADADAAARAGGSTTRTTTGGTTIDVPGSDQTTRTQEFLDKQMERLEEIQEERKGLAGRRGEIIEDRLGRRDIFGALSPYSYTDPAVQNILDVLGEVEDEGTRNEILAETRMVSSIGRQQIAPEFVEANILNPQALAQRVRGARDLQAKIRAQEQQVAATLAPLQRQLEYLQSKVGDLNEKRDRLRLLRDQGQDDPQLAAEIERLEGAEPEFLRIRQTVEQRMLKQRDLQTNLQSVTVGLEALEAYAQDPRGLERAWSSMSPEERLTITEAVRVSALAQADILENTIDATRESIRINEEDIQEYESSGATEFADEARRELQQNQNALNGLLLQQNEQISFASEGQSAINYLVENDPAYRIRPEDRLGARQGTVGALSDEAIQAQEEQQRAAAIEGKKEGRQLVDESFNRQIDEQLRGYAGAADLARQQEANIDESIDIARMQKARFQEQLDLLNDPSMLESASGVLQIQQIINEFGSSADPIAEDGLMGPNTRKGIEETKRDLQSVIDDATSLLNQENFPAEGLARFEAEAGSPRTPGTTPGQALPDQGIDFLPDTDLDFKALQEELDTITIPTGGERYSRPPNLTFGNVAPEAGAQATERKMQNLDNFAKFMEGERTIETNDDLNEFFENWSFAAIGKFGDDPEMLAAGKLFDEAQARLENSEPEDDDSLLEQNMSL